MHLLKLLYLWNFHSIISSSDIIMCVYYLIIERYGKIAIRFTWMQDDRSWQVIFQEKSMQNPFSLIKLSFFAFCRFLCTLWQAVWKCLMCWKNFQEISSTLVKLVQALSLRGCIFSRLLSNFPKRRQPSWKSAKNPNVEMC